MLIKDAKKVFVLVVILALTIMLVVHFFNDNWLDLELQKRCFNKTYYWATITKMGDQAVISILIITLLLCPRTRLRYGLGSAVTVTSSTLINRLLKALIQRPRPISAITSSMPSGHSQVSACFYLFVLFLYIYYHKDDKQPWKNLVIAFVLTTITLLVGYSRLALGVHYFTDVFVGLLIGVTLAGFSASCWASTLIKAGIRLAW